MRTAAATSSGWNFDLDSEENRQVVYVVYPHSGNSGSAREDENTADYPSTAVTQGQGTSIAIGHGAPYRHSAGDVQDGAIWTFMQGIAIRPTHEPITAQPIATETPRGRIESVHLNTRIRLRRIARESRGSEPRGGVTQEVERRAETLLERVWESSAASDGVFRDSTFVTITGYGAVQFEWEKDGVAIEALVEPELDFSVYVYPEDGEPEECTNLLEMVDVVDLIERRWSGDRRASSGV